MKQNCVEISSQKEYKKLRRRRGTARRAMSVEILLAIAQLYERNHF